MPSTTAPTNATATDADRTDADRTDADRTDADRTGAEETIAVLRGQIDGLDEAIIRLVAERAKLSARIQTTRMNAGGTRVEVGRERVIRAAFRDGLGPDGPELAGAILQVCRGRR